MAKRLAGSGFCDSVVCLAAVIRGDTPHFDYVAGEAARGLQEAALATGVPMVLRVLTTDHAPAGARRIGGSEGHKGEEAANTAIEMINCSAGSPNSMPPTLPRTRNASHMLRIVLPKGSLERATFQLFEDADLAVARRFGRGLPRLDRRPEAIDVTVLRPQEIPR